MLGTGKQNNNIIYIYTYIYVSLLSQDLGYTQISACWGNIYYLPLNKATTHEEESPMLDEHAAPDKSWIDCFNSTAQDDNYKNDTLSQDPSAAKVCLAIVKHLVWIWSAKRHQIFYLPSHFNPFMTDSIILKSLFYPTLMSLRNPNTYNVSMPHLIKQLIGLQDIFFSILILTLDKLMMFFIEFYFTQLLTNWRLLSLLHYKTS